MPFASIKHLQAGQESLKQLPEDEKLFCLSPSAGLLYLISERENPTPFNYPLVTAFGIDGQSEVVAAIENGAIDVICLSRFGESILRPRLLENYVQEYLDRLEPAEFCDIYNTSETG